MEDSNGDDLLKIFDQLDVKLLYSNPKVIRGWFDSDDEDLKNLLNWMCLSLSKDNYISPLETAEFSQNQNPLLMKDLEEEKYILENTEFPRMFDTDSNMLEIEFLEDEISSLLQKDEQLNELYKINGKKNKDLQNMMNTKISLDIKSSLQLKTTDEKYSNQCAKLDELNQKTHEKLFNYSQYLQNFEISSTPNFINNMDIRENLEKMENKIDLLMPDLEESVTSNVTVVSNVTNINDTITHDLYNLRHRILQSQKCYLMTKIKVETMKDMLSFIDTVSTQSLHSVNSLYSVQNIQAKEDEVRKMCSLLDESASKFADQQIFLTQMKYIEQEIESHEFRLKSLGKIDDAINRFLAYYMVLMNIYISEKTQIDRSQYILKEFMKYINKDLEDSKSRIVKMNKVIVNYEKSTPESRFKLAHRVMKILATGEENYTTARAFEILANFKKEIDILENNLFSFSFDDHRTITDGWKNSISFLKEQLVSGPTHRIVLISSELQSMFRKLEETFKKQQDSVKSVIRISSEMTKIPDKWQNYRRQLWMYFLGDPQKMKFILQSIEEHFTSSKLVKTR